MAEELDDTIQSPIDEQEESQDKGEKKAVNRPSYKKLYEDLLKKFEDKEEEQESDCLYQELHSLTHEERKSFSSNYSQLREESSYYKRVYDKLIRYFDILEGRILTDMPVALIIKEATELQDILRDINITLSEYKRLFNKTMIIPILTMLS